MYNSPVNVKHDASYVMGKVGKTKTQRGEFYTFAVIGKLHLIITA